MSAPHSAERIITLLTDFGSRDYFVGAMKGVILSINPHARIVDLSHEIPPQDIQAGAFNLLAVYKEFPAGTIHVAVVDPGVGSKRRAMTIECGGQFFVGPDNGLFSWICEREGKYRGVQLANETFFRHPVSTTFHGRDIFAPVAAALSNRVSLEEFGPPVEELIQLESIQPHVSSNGSVEGRILNIDHFGNCVTNLDRKSLPRDFNHSKLTIGDHEISSLRSHFSETADSDEVFCILGSAGFMEVVARNASAAKLLGIQRGQKVILI